MGKISDKLPLNTATLKKCREQVGLTLEDVEKKVLSIKEIEAGNKTPTYKQLDELADLYQVPRWVFIATELPAEYDYALTPAFRKFWNSRVFEDSKIKKLVVRVKNYRDLLIELKQDLQEPVKAFSPPDLQNISLIEETAKKTRQWLSMKDDSYEDFSSLKRRLEQKNIFVFLTGKYAGWSHIDKSFRGLCLTHAFMPVIIINDSDSRKAQSFTLIHELGHLLHDNASIDGDSTAGSEEERWCDRFAGEVLMPSSSSLWDLPANDLPAIKRLSRKFKVSPYACLVRLRQLRKMTAKQYQDFEQQLMQEYERGKETLESSEEEFFRNRINEVHNQFGDIYVHTIIAAWHNHDLTLHKATQLLDFKQPGQFLELQKQL